MEKEQRLIDATDAEKFAREHILDAKERSIILDFLRNCSTVEAAPIVHGKWIYDEEPDQNNNVQARCSVCFAGDLHSTAMMNKVPYCWKCGAKMDGGEADGERTDL